jgi:hypothetical protein
MRRADIISAALISIFGLLIIFVVIPVWVPGHEDGNYGLRAQDLPYITAIVATGLAMFFLVRRLFYDHSDDPNPPIPREGWIFLAIAAVILTVTWVLLQYIGILAGGPFVIAIFMYMMGERRPVAIIATATIAPLVVWGFFWKLLQFPLP